MARSDIKPMDASVPLLDSASGVDGCDSEVLGKMAGATKPIPMDPRGIWGLYCMYALLGLVNGFFVASINIPICQYVFGPMGVAGRSTVQQCNVAASISQMPWNFKIFYALFLDHVPFLGTRRRGWIIFGWTAALLALLISSYFVESWANEGNFQAYTMALLGACIFYIIADVAGDGVCIEMTKFEPEEVRGHILTTGQMARFTMSFFATFLVLIVMNGKSYVPPGKSLDSADMEFSFELSLGQVHILLFVLALPFWGLMVFWLRDPPKQCAAEHKGFGPAMRELWAAMQSKAMLALVVFSVGHNAFVGMQNPAANIVADIAAPTTAQNSIGAAIGNLLFILGVWIFRAFFMNRNWRVTLVWTTFLGLTALGFNFMVIYDAWGVGQDGWFYALSGALPSLIQGIGQVLSSLAVAEISPHGSEATTFEFIISVNNAALALNFDLQNIFTPIFELGDINLRSYSAANDSMRNEFNSRMAEATWLTMGINVGSVLIFMWLLPPDIATCKAWLKDEQWRKLSIGLITVGIATFCFIFSVADAFLALFPSTSCLMIAGGDGC